MRTQSHLDVALYFIHRGDQKANDNPLGICLPYIIINAPAIDSMNNQGHCEAAKLFRARPMKESITFFYLMGFYIINSGVHIGSESPYQL